MKVAKIDKLKKQAQDHMEEDETIIASVLGAYETKIMGSKTVRNGIFLATDKRLLFYAKKMTGYDLESFPYSNISSIEMSKGMMGHTITFFSSGNKVEMKWISQGEVEEFVKHTRNAIGKTSEPSSSPSTSHMESEADELKKFADLRDSGVISEEEFQQKKKQLLGL